jgi:hypothetical protein
MGQRIITTLIDDMDQTPESEKVQVTTVRFVVDGIEYEIDLRAENKDKLDEVRAQVAEMWAPWISNARRVGSANVARGKAGRRRVTTANGSLASEREMVALNRQAREWAIGEGANVSARGRLPENITEAYIGTGTALAPRPDRNLLPFTTRRQASNPAPQADFVEPQAPARPEPFVKGTWKGLGEPEGKRATVRVGGQNGELHTGVLSLRTEGSSRRVFITTDEGDSIEVGGITRALELAIVDDGAASDGTAPRKAAKASQAPAKRATGQKGPRAGKAASKAQAAGANA